MRGLLDHGARGLRRHGPERTHRVPARFRPGGGEDFARQCQVDRAARLAHGDVERAVDHGFHRLAAAQLVVPFDIFPQHAALVERLLAPMNGSVTRSNAAGLGERRAARGEQYRNVVARGIDDAVHRIRRADGDVHHDRGGLAGDAVIAVRHGHGDVLVRDRHEARNLGAFGVGQRLHDRGKIRPGIGEHVFDAALAEARDVGLGRHAVMGLGVGHGHTSIRWGIGRCKVTAPLGSVNEVPARGWSRAPAGAERPPSLRLNSFK